ncbi:MAG: hypothetical protein JWP87_5190 [Labilithrix sp.]|nr:hypothetical protein [Labilithrix sp.]
MRPFRGYAELANADEGEGRPSVVAGLARFVFVFGAFVSLTATGRLAPIELVSGMVSFAYVPVVHAIAVAVATRSVAREVRVTRAFALYAEGYGPWYLLMLLVAGGSLFAPAPARLLASVGGWMLLVALLWGGVLTFACFRSGLALSRRRAATATALHYVIVAGLVLGYFLAAGQLLPILPR